LTHLRRVKLLVYVAGSLLVVLGLVFSIFFSLHAASLMAGMNLVFSILGSGAFVLAWLGRVRVAAFFLIASMYAALLSLSLFVDAPMGDMPRSLHYYFPALGLSSYFILRGENPWVQHGVTSACLGAFVFFASSTSGFDTQFALADADRPAVWVVAMVGLGTLLLLLHVFMGDLNRMEHFLHTANNRFVNLVRGMFPQVIAERLLATGKTFSERHPDCSILFADIVGFTSLAERTEPQALVAQLADIFSRFDRCVAQNGLTKIKTIGDAYMVAAGVPEPNPDHAVALLVLAQEMFGQIRGMEGIDLRIGIASGELVAGVIGQTRQVFDVWGDAVNIAARMESQGLPGRIQVSEATYLQARGHFDFELRPGLAIKGKDGRHDAYVLRGRLPGGSGSDGDFQEVSP
jgi:class 3 adenylate cyclase